jgi:CheY-like chemotaxis protein
MTIETLNSNKNYGSNKSSEDFLEKSRKNIETYSIVAIFCLIAAVILITFNLRLPAGIMVIAGASLGLIIVRRSFELNKKIKKTLSEFSSLSEQKDDVITDFSHKIREPLNNLVIITDMLMESGLEKKQKELLETFIASTNNMVTTVNELSMQSAGNLSYEPRKAIRFSLLSTLQNTLDLYLLKDKANIDFVLNKKEFHELECFGDPIILKQIFLDLFTIIENHASERAITVNISLKKEKEMQNETLVAFRLQTNKNIVLIDEKADGKSLAARLITSGKGSFHQEFGNNYTVLTILLPFANPVAEPRQKTASTKMEELIKKEKPHKDLKDIKILLVEDNLINQKITLLTLSPLVHSIDTACNGKEALDKFGTTNYDLILMDIQMPIMSGLVAAEKIRALESTTNSHVPIIAITANAMIGDKEKCLSVGIDDYISKPFQPAALIDKIKKTI